MCWESDMKDETQEKSSQDVERKKKLGEALKDIIVEGFRKDAIVGSKN